MRILYLTCLISEKEKYDGERIKNTLIFDSLKKIADVDVIDFTKNKYANVLKTFLVSLFKKHKYDYFFISKDPHGANIIQKLLHFSKVPFSKIVYFEIGPFLYDRILNGSINKEIFINDRLIVVETKSMKKELESLDFKNVDVFPNFKPIYNVKFIEQKYPKNVLKLIYFSRIEDQKGIYDLIECLHEINSTSTKYILDIFGRPQNKDEEKQILDISNKYDYLNYKGKLDICGTSSYEQLSKYDLHVFPTKYAEGFPGTIIDFFIAGVPTLASSFARADDILNSTDSIIFKQDNRKDLVNKLQYIYDNQGILNNLRKHSFARKEEYSTDAFDVYLNRIIKKMEKENK